MSDVRELVCSDGHVLYYRVWKPKGRSVVAVLHILHGMAEYGARYDRFATFLNGHGIVVYAQDHRGHGLTATKAGETLGWFAEHDGWQRIALDSYELSNEISNEYPTKPLFLMGHSMGSFLARTLMVQHSELYSGVIAMGTGSSMGLLGKIGRMIARHHVRKFGSQYADAKLDAMSFGSYNKKIEHPATSFDWLSNDEAEVRSYVEDPLCGFVCTAKFFDDLLEGIEFANDGDRVDSVPKDLPVLLISGSEDPVGNFGKGVRTVYALYQDAGITDLTLRLVKGGRHELLNDTDRDATMQYLLSWVEQRV